MRCQCGEENGSSKEARPEQASIGQHLRVRNSISDRMGRSGWSRPDVSHNAGRRGSSGAVLLLLGVDAKKKEGEPDGRSFA
jgi:hypothetical protein